MMNNDEQTKLQQAHSLIQQKQYSQARAILQTIEWQDS